MGDNSKVYVVEVKLSLNIKPEDIDDIMCVSLEGGFTTNWCDKVNVEGEYLGEYASEQISRGGTLIFYDSVEDKKYKLTLDKFLKGLKIWAEKGYDYEGAITINEIDTCQIDAIAADGIIQCALFGDIIYG